MNCPQETMVFPADIWNKYKRWCRLVILLHEGGEVVCKDILCEVGVRDVTDGAEIYRKLEPYKDMMKKMPRYQQKALLPDTKVIDTIKLDLSLKTCVIEILDTRKKFPLIKEIRDRRNDLFHMSDVQRNMSQQQFNHFWEQISQLLIDLGYNMNLLEDLKTEDHLSEQRKSRFEDIRPYIQGKI